MSKIEWTDKTWNPITGCTPCSPGCMHCYAKTMAHRLQAMGQEKYRNGFDIKFHEASLKEPYFWKTPKKVFVCSMSDLFHEAIEFEVIDRVMKTVVDCQQHTFQMLTKRPKRMKEYFHSRHDKDFEIYRDLENLWIGTTVENHDSKGRIEILRSINLGYRFISFEPLLNDVGELDFGGVHCGMHWIIVGGETGVGARPMNPDWARSIRDQCREWNIPFFFKKIDGKQPIPEDLMIREFPKLGE